MTMSRSESPEPTLEYLSFLMNRWLEEHPDTSQLQFAQLVTLPDGSHPSRPTISNVIKGVRGASYTMVKAIAAALGKTGAQLEQEAGEWWKGQQEARRAEEEERASRARSVKGHVASKTALAPTRNLAAALEHAGVRDPVSQQIRDALVAASAELPQDPRLSTWLAMIEDLQRA